MCIRDRLCPAFAPARPVSLAVKLPYAFALFEWFPTILREPLSASDTLSEAKMCIRDSAYRRRRLSAKQGAGNDKFDGKDRIGISHG